MFEWVRQIKAYATVIKWVITSLSSNTLTIRAESLGYGSAIRAAHSAGTADLGMELDLHEHGLKQTPRPYPSSQFTDTIPDSATALGHDTAGNEKTPSNADVYRAAMIAQGHAYDSPSSQMPFTMCDFFTRKSLSPRGQDLASFLDKADIEWRLQQAESIRKGSVVSTDSLLACANRIRSMSNRRLSTQTGSDVYRSTSISSNGHAQRGPPLPPPAGPPPPVPSPQGRPPAVPPPRTALPPLPPPTIPLPPTPQMMDPKLSIETEEAGSPVSPSRLVTPGIPTEESSFPLTPGGEANGSRALPESPLISQLEGMNLSPTATPVEQEDKSHTTIGEEPGDVASISSKGSSARLRRMKKQIPAMDLSTSSSQ